MNTDMPRNFTYTSIQAEKETKAIIQTKTHKQTLVKTNKHANTIKKIVKSYKLLTWRIP